jgi:hypothetical protein
MKLASSDAAEPSLPSTGDLLTGAAAARQAVIERTAVALGLAWADGWRQDLRQQGRSASGGWPGTMREARMRVGHTLRVEMDGKALPALTEVEREVAARKVYASARGAWCKSADR